MTGKNLKNPRLVLASGSPRRRELLAWLGIPFVVSVSNAEEKFDSTLPPIKIAESLALLKAKKVAQEFPDNCLILGADTIVFLGNRVFGKPKDKAHAKRMLMDLRGKTHEVITGLAVIDNRTGREEINSVLSRVKMRNFTSKETDEYVASKEPMDKAAGYAIQGRGRGLIEKYEGCFNNIVGLPLCETARILHRLGMQTKKDETNSCFRC